MTRITRFAAAGIALATIATPFIASAGTCPGLFRTLARNAEGSDVRELQLFLSERGYLSPALVIGVFGLKTENAVKAFQAEQGIVSAGTPASTGYGAVGGRTRAKIASICLTAGRTSGQSSQAQSTNPYSSVNIVIPVNTVPVQSTPVPQQRVVFPRIDVASVTPDKVLINFFGMPPQSILFMIDPVSGRRLEMAGYSPLTQGGNGYITYPMLGEFAGNTYAFAVQASSTKVSIATSSPFTVPKPSTAGVGAAEVGTLQVFDGEVTLLTAGGITRANAETRCKYEKTNNPLRNTRCTFNGYHMFVQ